MILPYKAKPMKFRQWIICEDLKTRIVGAVESDQFPELVMEYISTAFGIPKSKLEKLSWVDCLYLFGKASEFSPKINIPIISDAHLGSGKPIDWDYQGRRIKHYAHVLAKAYGWSLEYIWDLEPEMAMALIQEVLTDDQLEEEFYYSLSDVAYVYNSSTKKSTYRPLPRPYWMKQIKAEPPKKVKMRRDMMPVGRIVDVSGMPENMQIEGLVTEKPGKK